MAKLSAKQLAMAWINNCLAVEKINPDAEEFQAIAGRVLDDKVIEDATNIVKAELAKTKTRFQHYVDVYVTPRVKPSIPKEDDHDEESADTKAGTAGAPTGDSESSDATGKEGASNDNGNVSA